MSLRTWLAAKIGVITDRGSRWLAPAMPWIFLCLRRALIPTLCWVVLAVFFFVVPQSREVLHGLSEPPLKSIYDFTGEMARLVNVWSLTSYVGMAIVIALCLWYSARLLSTVEADNATPPALIAGHGLQRLQFATTWLPRLLGVSALAASVGALVYANYTPQLRQIAALLLVVAAVLGPILVASATLAQARLNPVRRRVLWIIGLVVFVIAAWLLHTNTEKWRVWLWSVGVSILPGCMWVFLVKRRELLVKLRMDTTGVANTARHFGEVVVTVMLLLVGGVSALLLLALSPPFVVRGFGSAASVLLFLTSAVLLLTAVQLVLRRIARDVPGLTTATLLVIAIGVAVIGKESVGTEQLEVPTPSATQVANAPPDVATATAAAGTRPLARRTYVNAYGGGLRAAVFTAEVLAQADDATCGAFGQQVVAFSGVSGGSLGIATYLVARQEFVARGGWKDCKVTKPQEAATPLTDLVTKALVQDHLSPAIARMLAVDAPHIPGSPVRGQALLDSWNGALVDALAEKQSADKVKPAALAMRLADLNGGLAPPARVYFNATDADTGQIRWFSNGDDGSTADNIGAKPVAVGAMSVGQAVLHSARFPIVSPAGAFKTTADAPLSRLIDGGYADNSGATTLLRDLRARPLQLPAGLRPVYINIDGNPPEQGACSRVRGPPPILTALRGLLQARAAHATLAVRQFSDELGVAPLLVQLDLEEAYGVPPTDAARDSPECEKVRRAQQAPLGWYVSYGAAKTIATSAALGMDRVFAVLGTSRKQDMPTPTPAK